MPSPFGQIVLDYCRQRRISIPGVATRMGMTRTGLYKTLKSRDIKMSRVRALSHILNHNFFEDYYPSHKYPSDNISPLAAENKLLKEKNNQLETEITYLREIFRLIKSNSSDSSSNKSGSPASNT